MADQYTRENQIALEVWADDGQSEFNGISKRTLDAFARRGLVWYETNSYGRRTGGLTDKGRAVLAQLAPEPDVNENGDQNAR